MELIEMEDFPQVHAGPLARLLPGGARHQLSAPELMALSPHLDAETLELAHQSIPYNFDIKDV